MVIAEVFERYRWRGCRSLGTVGLVAALMVSTIGCGSSEAGSSAASTSSSTATPTSSKTESSTESSTEGNPALLADRSVMPVDVACGRLFGMLPEQVDTAAGFANEDEMIRAAFVSLYDDTDTDIVLPDPYRNAMIEQGIAFYAEDEVALDEAYADVLVAQADPAMNLELVNAGNLELGHARCDQLHDFAAIMAADAPLGTYDAELVARTGPSEVLTGLIESENLEPWPLDVEEACDYFDPAGEGIKVSILSSEEGVSLGANQALLESALAAAENDIMTSAAWYSYEDHVLSGLGIIWEEEERGPSTAVLVEDAHKELMQFDYVTNRDYFDSLDEYYAPCEYGFDDIVAEAREE